MEGDEVVQLERLPWLPGLRVGVRVGRRVEGADRDLVGLDVVRVGVAAAFVVGEYDVRAEPADCLDDGFGGLVERREGEAAFG